MVSPTPWDHRAGLCPFDDELSSPAGLRTVTPPSHGYGAFNPNERNSPMADTVQVHFVSGEKIEIPGTVAQVQGQLISGRGGLVTLKDRHGADISVNPEHVAFVQGMPDPRTPGA